MNFFLSLVPIILSTALGCSLIRVFDSKNLLKKVELLSLGFVIGLGLVTWWMIILIHFKQTLELSFLLGPIVGFSALFFVLSMIFNKLHRSKESIHYLKWSLSETLMLLGIGIHFLVVLFQALTKPMEAFDAVFNWGLKAKAIALSQALPWDLFNNSYYPHSNYPLLVPLSQVFSSSLIDGYDEFSSKWIFPLYLLAMASFLFASFRRSLLDRKSSLFFAFMLVSIPFVIRHSFNGYADWIFSVYFSMSSICLYFWVREQQKIFFFLSAILIGMAGLTKDEGLALCILQVVLIGFCCSEIGYSSVKDKLRVIVSYFLVVCAVLFPWLLLKVLIGGTTHAINTTSFLTLSWDRLTRIIPIAYQYQNQVFGLRVWNLIWIIFLVAVVFNFKKFLLPELRYLFFAILGVFFVYTSVYILIPEHPEMDITWYLKTTASRLFLHPISVVIFIIGLFYQLEKTTNISKENKDGC